MKIASDYKVQFEELYISYFPRLKGFAQEYIIRGEDAENIVHDVFIELWEKQVEFSSFVNFNGYLFVMIKNRCIDFLRRKLLEQQAVNRIQDEHTRALQLKFQSLEALDSSLLSSQNIESIIQSAIDSLPEKCREIFVMSKIEGKKQKHIAEELNISIHTVESQMAVAYKKLKEALKDYLPLLNFLII